MIPNCGHVVNVEQPEIFNSQVLKLYKEDLRNHSSTRIISKFSYLIICTD